MVRQKRKTKLGPRFRGCILWRIVLSVKEIGKSRMGVSLGEKVMSLISDILNWSNRKISSGNAKYSLGVWYFHPGENEIGDVDWRVICIEVTVKTTQINKSQIVENRARIRDKDNISKSILTHLSLFLSTWSYISTSKQRNKSGMD